jgi:hypothetical protein
VRVLQGFASGRTVSAPAHGVVSFLFLLFLGLLDGMVGSRGYRADRLEWL